MSKNFLLTTDCQVIQVTDVIITHLERFMHTVFLIFVKLYCIKYKYIFMRSVHMTEFHRVAVIIYENAYFRLRVLLTSD